MSQTANTPTVTLTGANTYTGTTFVNGIIVNLNTTGAAAIAGNLVISGGNNNGTDSLPIANATVQLLQSNQIATTATVTINGGAQLNLNNFNNTIAGLAFTNDGGSNGNNGPGVVHRFRHADRRRGRHHVHQSHQRQQHPGHQRLPRSQWRHADRERGRVLRHCSATWAWRSTPR